MGVDIVARNLISDLTPTGNGAALQALLTSGGPRVILPVGSVYNLDSDVTVQNQDLTICGTIVGTHKLILTGSVALTGAGLGRITGGAFISITTSGDYTISGLRFDNITNTAAININLTPNAIVSSLVVFDNTFANINYGVLRSGGTSSTIQATQITNNLFYTLQGDAIELNIIPLDRKIIITNNTILNVNNTRGSADWGLGIGIAGLAYDNTFALSNMGQDILIDSNIITNSKQGIHLEACRNFTISNNSISGINTTYSPNTGLEEGGIVCYGCGYFTIKSNNVNLDDTGRGIYINPGVVSASYVGLPENFTVDSNVLNSTADIYGINWSTSGAVSITNNTASGLSYTGGPSGITITGNSWQ